MKYLLAAVGALLVASPALAHRPHRFHRQYHTGRHEHTHCHRDGNCHWHSHSHYGKDAGHHGEKFMHHLHSHQYKYNLKYYNPFYYGPSWEFDLH